MQFSLLTANFNNKDLTNAMIMSFRKQYGKCHVYVVDNSTLQKYSTDLEDITIIDNFNYKNTPDVYENGVTNYNYPGGRPSVFHSGSIEYAFSKINDEYIALCDNDIMFYPSIKKLLDEFDYNNYDVIGEINHDAWPQDRLFPYFCLINLAKIKQNNIHYYTQNSITPFKRDTGGYFLEELNKNNIKIKSINLDEYIIHLKSASFGRKNIDEFLEQTKNLRPLISIVMPTHKPLSRLHATLGSVFQQEYNNWELIVVDSSDDKYFEKWFNENIENNIFLKQFKKYKNKVKIIKPTKDTTYPGNMYLEGLNCTSCDENDFVIFLDDDDFLANHLFENIYDISYKYPEVEMISSDYISPLFDGDKVLKNLGRFDGTKCVAEQSEIWIKNLFFKYPKGFMQWRNIHPFKSNLHPKIVKKKTIIDNRYKIFTNTEVKSDASFRVQNITLKEAYILDVGYYWVRDFKQDTVTSEYLSKKKRTPSKFALESEKLLTDFENYLTTIGFKKDRIYYTPKHLNYKIQ